MIDPVRRGRAVALTLLVVAGTVNYLDRSAVSIANPLIRRDLHLSFGQMGLLLSAFAWAYGLAQIPGGVLVDRYGPKRAIGWGLALWSAAQVAAGFVFSLGQFIAARAALGLGEAPMYTGGTRVCADWWGERERTLPVAVFNASASLGPAIAPAVLTALMLALGWRSMFMAVGLLGVAVVIAWVFLYRSPNNGGGPGGKPSPPAFFLLRTRSTWFLFFGFFGVIYLTWLYATWLPDYLVDQRHLGVVQAGWLTSIPLGCGFLGAISGGVIADRLCRAGMSPRQACRLPLIFALVGTGVFTAAGALVSSLWPAIALLSAGVFLANMASSCGWALGAVLVPPAEVGTLEAIQNVGGSLGGALAPAVTGFAVQATGSFVPPFLLAAGVALGSAAIYALMPSGHVAVRRLPSR